MNTWRRIESSPHPAPGDTWALELLSAYFRDVAQQGYDPANDIAYINQRFSHEGLAFVTTSLARLGSSILDGFREGIFHCPAGFVIFKNPQLAALPKFLSGLLRKVFIGKTGVLLSKPDTFCAKALHQICSMFKKLAADMTDELTDQHYTKMLDFDASLPSELELTPSGKFVLNSARVLISKALHGLDLGDITPKHGSGAVSTKGLTNYEKHDPRILHALYTAKLQAVYPWYKYFHYNYRHLALVEEGGQIPFSFSLEEAQRSHGEGKRPRYVNKIMPRGVRVFRDPETYSDFWREAQCTRTLCVPKTANKLRVISAEPAPNMAIQLGQQKALVKCMEMNPLTKGHINFHDQSVNREKALESSWSNENATLDMTNASDSVSTILVKALFPKDVFRMLSASRTRYTSVAWKSTGFTSYRKLNKFAPMGNGYCFPVESIVFWALASGVIYRESKIVDVLEATSLVYTYGDDLIVPREFAEPITRFFKELGLIVNVEKTFTTGPFRESCGMDAFMGANITPIKVKMCPPERRSEGSNASAWNDYAAAFAERGLQRCAEVCYHYLEKVYGALPYRLPNMLYIGRVCQDIEIVLGLGKIPFTHDIVTFAHPNNNRDKRQVEIKAWAIENKPLMQPLTADAGLWRWFSTTRGTDRDSSEFTDKDGLLIRNRLVVLCRY